MARTKGSKNKSQSVNETVLMTAEARIELLANLLVEWLLDEKVKLDADYAT